MGKMTAEQRIAIDAFMRACLHREFAWGAHDCGTFCGAVLHILTGRDLWEPYRNKYRGACDGNRLMRAVAHDVPGSLGMHETAAPADGDLCVIERDGRAGFGIYWQGAAMQPGELGIVRVPRGLITKTFRASWGR